MNINYVKSRIKRVSSNNYDYVNTDSQNYVNLRSVYATKIMYISQLSDNMELTINETGCMLYGTLSHENLGSIAYVHVLYEGIVPYNDKLCIVLLSEYY